MSNISNPTEAARLVLEDCKGALADFKDGMQGRVWWRHWILSVILLRAVGHVLHKVDGKKDEKLKKIIEEKFKKLKDSEPEPEIYWYFIESERNKLIKQYESAAGQGITIKVPTLQLKINIGMDKDGVDEQKQELVETIYHYTFNEGPFKGRDQRDVIQEAIDWWQDYLNNIDELFIK